MNTEIKTSHDLEQMMHSEQDKLKEQIAAKGTLENMAADLRRKKLELKAEISQVDVELSGYTQAIQKARNNIREHEINLDQFRSAFWTAKKDGR